MIRHVTSVFLWKKDNICTRHHGKQTNSLTTSEHTFEFAYTDFLCHLKADILSLLYLWSLIVFRRKRRHDSNVSKIVWKPFEVNLIFTQMKLLRWSLFLSFASPTLSILSTTNFSVYSREDLAVIAALKYSGVWKQIKIKMLFTAGRSVLYTLHQLTVMSDKREILETSFPSK